VKIRISLLNFSIFIKNSTQFMGISLHNQIKSTIYALKSKLEIMKLGEINMQD
jgi:hypothetical protein